MFSIHRSSFKYWLKRENTLNVEQIRRQSLVRKAFSASHGSAGARTIADIVSTLGVPLSRYRAVKLMKSLVLICCQQPKHSYKKSGHEHVVIPNHLARQFAVTAPNQVWCGDVTYIWTGNRWAYLAVVLVYLPESLLVGRYHYHQIQG